MEIVKMVLGSSAGSFAFVFGILLFIFWVYGKFVKLIAKHESFEKTCERLEAKYEKMGADIQELRGEMQYVKSSLNSIMNMVQNISPLNSHKGASPALAPMLQAHSPLSLTETGRRAVVEMGADDALAVNWERIKQILEAEVSSRNPYDVQTYCLERIPIAPERFIDPAHLDAIKRFAFSQGRTLFDCLKVFGVLVRDRFFSEEGIPLSALDTPKTNSGDGK